VFLESAERGETEAVHFALAAMKSESIETVLVIPADIPLLLASDLELLLNEDRSKPSVLLVPSHDEMGTNALLLCPPDIMRPRFGHNSFAFHLREAVTKGLRPKVVRNERMALDIDEPKDLRRFLAMKGGGETRKRVLAMTILDRPPTADAGPQ
jgi:2-phospho-L-lactate guanylyltransferase